MIKDGSKDKAFFEDCLQLLTLMREHADIADTDKFWEAAANHYFEICWKYDLRTHKNQCLLETLWAVYSGFQKQYKYEQKEQAEKQP